MLTKAQSVSFVLLGVAGLLLKQRYSGPYQEIVVSYAGNIAVSFAVYFIVRLPPLLANSSRLLAAGIALATVELFEATNGFGVMTNVYDQTDFLANAIGIGLALAGDSAASRISGRRSRQGGQTA